ncbi:galactokinase [Ornithinimicrobium cerasi]|uniref:galactokinase n=1 Tax=Ornithinimicrobium cerasi TaxID=2248773 RepID=UPI000EFEF320|nr:galactokinase [Ornithinimicrobium cerasi]
MSNLTWLEPADDDTVAETLDQSFRRRFGVAPDGVWAAPGRVNLIGEHTDYNGGFALPLALPHRTYAAVRVRGDGVLRIASAQQPSSWQGRVEEVGPGRPEGWPAYVAGVVWALGDRLPDGLGLDVLVDGHVPLGAGLSSSAALSCSVGVAVRDLVRGLAGLSDADLAAACVRAENEVAGAATGGMDQTVSLRAVDEHLLLIDAREHSVLPVAWTLPGHEVLVVDTRAHHSLADGQYAARRHACESAATALGVGSLRELDPGRLEDADVRRALADVPDGMARVRHVVTENGRVLDLVGALQEQDAVLVGSLMTGSHESLRDDYEVSCRELDVAVTAALGAGALGARMTGGGFGGSAIALVDREDVELVAGAVAEAFADEGLTEPHFLEAAPSRPAGRLGPRPTG